MKTTTLKLDGCSSSRIEQITYLLDCHGIDYSADRYFTQLNFEDLWENNQITLGQIAKRYDLTLVEPTPVFVDYSYFD